MHVSNFTTLISGFLSLSPISLHSGYKIVSIWLTNISFFDQKKENKKFNDLIGEANVYDSLINLLKAIVIFWYKIKKKRKEALKGYIEWTSQTSI